MISISFTDGNKVKLRKIRFSDVSDIIENLSDKGVAKWIPQIPFPYRRKHAINYIKKTHYQLKNKKAVALGIELKESKRLIGTIGLKDIDWKNKSAVLGYLLGRKYWGKGLMAEAIKLMLAFGFKKLKLHRVSAKVYEPNKRSQRVLEKCWFKKEGIRRHALYKFRKWHNEILYAILASEFKVFSPSKRF